MMLMTMLVLPTTVLEGCWGVFTFEYSCNGNGYDYDVGADIGADDKNFTSFCLSCQIIAGADNNYDDEVGEGL